MLRYHDSWLAFDLVDVDDFVPLGKFLRKAREGLLSAGPLVAEDTQAEKPFEGVFRLASGGNKQEEEDTASAQDGNLNIFYI